MSSNLIKKTSNTIKMTDKSRSKINSAEAILKSIKIPETFENRGKITGGIRLLSATSSGVKAANSVLVNKINEIASITKEKILLASRSLETIILLLASEGYSYDEIQEMYSFYKKYRYADNMPDQKKKAWEYYDEINRILAKYSGVLSSREVIEKNPLDEDYNEIPNLSDDMLKYLAYMENTFTDSSQCQGAVWLGNNKIAICDIDGDLDKGVIRIIEIDPNNPENIEVISEIPVDGHSNDIAYIPDDNVIIHPNNATGELEAIYLDKNLNEKDREVVRNQQENGIDYDKENNKIIVTEDINVETYSYESFFGDGEPESRTVIPDAIKDEENDIYYNIRGGTFVKDGDVYVCYTGYEEDKRKYDAYGDPPDIPKTTMTVIYDSETGKC